MRLTATIFAIATGLASPALAFQDGWAGPWLIATTDQETLVIAAMGDPEPGAVSTYLFMDGTLIRADSVIEADCAGGRRRTGDIQVFLSDTTGERGEHVTTVAGLPWTPWGPNDTFLRDYLCDGVADPANVQATPGPSVRAWASPGSH